MSKEKENDIINSPEHYTQGKIEVIDFIEGMSFCAGNAIKYLCRYSFKGKPLEDLKKARWYVERLIKIETEKERKVEPQVFTEVPVAKGREEDTLRSDSRQIAAILAETQAKQCCACHRYTDEGRVVRTERMTSDETFCEDCIADLLKAFLGKEPIVRVAL